jgi:hypothetical protein
MLSFHNMYSSLDKKEKQLVIGGSALVLTSLAIGMLSRSFKRRDQSEPLPEVDPLELVSYSPSDETYTEPSALKPVLTSGQGIASIKPTTVMQVFQKAVKNSPNVIAMKVERGPDHKWQEWTWLEYYNDVMCAARAFVSLGVRSFDSVNIIGFNTPEWVIANNGAIAAGAKAAGIYATNGVDACRYITQHSGGRVSDYGFVSTTPLKLFFSTIAHCYHCYVVIPFLQCCYCTVLCSCAAPVQVVIAENQAQVAKFLDANTHLPEANKSLSSTIVDQSKKNARASIASL